MSGAYLQSVKGATKTKLAAPKSKYIQHLLEATNQGESQVDEIFRALAPRLKDPGWTIVFKSLIVIHMLIRDGYKNVVLEFMTTSRTFRISSLTSTGCSPMSDQGKSINEYGTYLTTRVKAFANVKTDYVKTKADPAGSGRLRKLTIEKGLLRETEIVQAVIGALIACNFLEKDVDNEISLTAFRLLVADLLVLFQVANEGVINVLEHYFEMTRVDAERALKIYQKFVDQTDGVIEFMSLARSLESITRLTIPNLQHAPTSLGNSLEEYLRDPDFEQNRIQYLAQKGLKGQGNPSTANTSENKAAGAPLKSALKISNGRQAGDTNPFGAPQLPAQMATSGNADLIDFFGSIEPQQPSQPVSAYPMQQAQMTGLSQQFTSNPYSNPTSQMPGSHAFSGQSAPAQYNEFQQYQSAQRPITQIAAQPTANGYNPYVQSQQQSTMLPQSTGAGFGSYAPQAPQSLTHSQYSAINTLQPQVTGSNPFRKSILPQATGSVISSQATSGIIAPQRTGNPFSRSGSGPPTTGTPLFSPQPQQSFQPQYASQPMPQQNTGNPFNGQQQQQQQQQQYGYASATPSYQQMTGSSPGLTAQQTGSSNPFRQSQMLPTMTGQFNAYAQ